DSIQQLRCTDEPPHRASGEERSVDGLESEDAMTLDTGTATVISGVVCGLCQIAKGGFGMHGRWALALAAILSALTVAVWGWSHPETLVRTASWDFLTTWFNVFSGAAGIFGIVVGTPGAAKTVARGVKEVSTSIVQSVKRTGGGV